MRIRWEWPLWMKLRGLGGDAIFGIHYCWALSAALMSLNWPTFGKLPFWYFVAAIGPMLPGVVFVAFLVLRAALRVAIPRRVSEPVLEDLRVVSSSEESTEP